MQCLHTSGVRVVLDACHVFTQVLPLLYFSKFSHSECHIHVFLKPEKAKWVVGI